MQTSLAFLLRVLARCHPLNRRNLWVWTYPQLWFAMPSRLRHPRWHRWLQKTCGWVGHEISQTEIGYRGGKFSDRWCRWCNTHIQIPVAEDDLSLFTGVFDGVKNLKK